MFKLKQQFTFCFTDQPECTSPGLLKPHLASWCDGTVSAVTSRPLLAPLERHDGLACFLSAIETSLEAILYWATQKE